MDEFTVRNAPVPTGKRHHVFKLHKDDTLNWTGAKMRRDESQQWQIKLGSGRTARRYKAVKEGGVSENASYFILYKPEGSSDTYEVCPIEEWFSVSATQRYTTLTAEQAEQRFEQRHKTLNLFSVMHSKKNGESGEDGFPSHNRKSFKISELDDWDQSGDDLDDESGDDGADEDTKKKLRKKKGVKKEKDDEAPEEGKEESDEGDFEQREVDYMSDTSSSSSMSESEQKDGVDVKGIAEELALRDLLSTDDEEEIDTSQQKNVKSSGNKNTTGSIDTKLYPDGNESDDSSDSDDYDVDEDKMDSMFMKKGLPAQLVKQEVKQEQDSHPAGSSSQTGVSGNSSNSGQKNSSAASNKRKMTSSESLHSNSQPQTKRACPVEPVSTSPANSLERTIEDLIRKYLGRKPMTLKTLLKEIKSKLRRLGGVEMDNDLVNTIALIIKRLNPERQKINDVTYLSLKA